jgi:hypothetical protein
MPLPNPAEPAVLAQDWLAGGGELGALVRELDWSTTPLGALSGWPPSLRTTVSACLNSRLPLLIYWGQEQIAIYNDAYRPLLGNKHPRSLGQSAAECWPEVWGTLGPTLARVASEAKATWSENELLQLDRRGFSEECYFTFSFSPVRNPSGSVGGISCTVT